jgi:hypothetical protein
VLAVIVSNRSELSHFAGGRVLNAADDSARYSTAFEVFHDEIHDLNVTSRRGDDQVTVDWAHDCARLRLPVFPIVQDPLLGWRLHLFDMAVNKALALSARTVTRDYIDILELSRIYPLEAIVWAACGKDKGFSPASLLMMMRRFAKTEPGPLDKIKARELDPIQMTMEWIEISTHAEMEITRVADKMIDIPIGVPFVNEKENPDGSVTTRT